MSHESVRRVRGASRPFVGKGIKFYLSEWAIVSQLMDVTGLNITDLIKVALREHARRHGLPWPGEDSPKEKAS